MLRRFKNKVSSLLIFFLLLSQAAYINANADTNYKNLLVQKQYNYKRIGGVNRIDTSIEIAKEFSSDMLQNIVLSSAYNYPDALSGSVLTKKLNAPILLVGQNSSDNSSVLDYIKKHLDPNGNIYILGGNGAVSDDIISSINALGFKNFTRLGGADRVETNLKIQKNLGAASGTPVVIVSENNFPDAVSISSVAAAKGYPILLSDYDSLNKDTIDYISSVKPSKIYIIGGTGVIGSNVEEQLEPYSPSVVRISGADRFETSLEVNRFFNLDTNSALIATGCDFPDALSGSALAAKLNAHILLTNSADVSKQKQLLDSTSINNLYILGGNGVISESAVSNLSKLQVKPNVQTLTGYITTEDDFVNPNIGGIDPSTDTKPMILMKVMAEAGLGIAVKQGDGTYKFYYFDGSISTGNTTDSNGKWKFDGTGSQLNAWNLVENTTKYNNIAVTVTGTFDGTIETNPGPDADGKVYPVIKVSSLSENTSVLNSIEVTNPAAKLIYSVGDKLDLTGLQVTGKYEDNSTTLQNITSANVTGFDSSTSGSKTLTITVGGKTTTYTINVKPVPISITITSPAVKLNYTVGDRLDLTGLQVTASYSDGSTSVLPITAANVSGFTRFSPASGEVLTITAGGKTATYTVNINTAVVNLTGYIEDEDCFEWYADPANKSKPGYDTKECLSMDGCASNGYGIAVLQSDNTYKFYYFDGAFAPNATGTQLSARKLIKDITKSDHITIKVTGTLNGDTKISPYNGKSYPVITVTSLTEN